MILYVSAAILSGAAIVGSRIFNAVLGENIGVFQSTMFNYIVGLSLSVLVLMISGEPIFAGGFSLSTEWWIYLGGSVGVITIVLSNMLTSKLSSFNLTLLIFIGQLFTGVLLDYVMTQEFSLGKILGGALVLAGLTFNLSIDRKEAKEA